MLPVLWIVSLSLKSPATITDKRLWPVDPTLENYRSIAGSALFTRALLNSVGIGLIDHGAGGRAGHPGRVRADPAASSGARRWCCR